MNPVHPIGRRSADVFERVASFGAEMIWIQDARGGRSCGHMGG
jgi:hypothetical protein